MAESEKDNPFLSISINESDRLTLIGLLGAVISSVILFMVGYTYITISKNFVEWFLYSFFAQMLFTLTTFEVKKRINKGTTQRVGFNNFALCLCVMVKPFFGFFISISKYDQISSYIFIDDMSNILEVTAIIFESIVVSILFFRIKRNHPMKFINSYMNGINPNDIKNVNLTQKDNTKEIVSKGNSYTSEESPKELLGKGVSIFDSVIKSMLYRANNSQRITSLSLIAIVVLVIVGGSASIGTVALDEVNKIRELEIQRNKIIFLSNRLSVIVEKHEDLLNLKKYIDITNKYIMDQYNQEDSYKVSIEKIQQQSNTSWPDIAMRVAVAALTLFLVQIFFNIYKYNQQQSSYLNTKAELIELYKETEADKKDLRNGLLSKLDSGPAFGQGPSSPADQIINIIDKVKGG